MGRFYSTSTPQYQDFVQELPAELLAASLNKTITDKNKVDDDLGKFKVALKELDYRPEDEKYFQEILNTQQQNIDKYAEIIKNDPSKYRDVQRQLKSEELKLHNELQTGDLGKIVKEKKAYKDFLKGLNEWKKDKQDKGQWTAFDDLEYNAILKSESQKYKTIGGVKGGGRNYNYPNSVGYNFSDELYEIAKTVQPDSYEEESNIQGVFSDLNTSKSFNSVGGQKILEALYNNLSGVEGHSTLKHYADLGMFPNDSIPIQKITKGNKTFYKVDENHPLASTVEEAITRNKRSETKVTNKSNTGTNLNMEVAKSFINTTKKFYSNIYKIDKDKNLIYLPVDVSEKGQLLFVPFMKDGTPLIKPKLTKGGILRYDIKDLLLGTEIRNTVDFNTEDDTDMAEIRTKYSYAPEVSSKVFTSYGSGIESQANKWVQYHAAKTNNTRGWEDVKWEGLFVNYIPTYSVHGNSKKAFGGRIRPYFAYGGSVPGIPPTTKKKDNRVANYNDEFVSSGTIEAPQQNQQPKQPQAVGAIYTPNAFNISLPNNTNRLDFLNKQQQLQQNLQINADALKNSENTPYNESNVNYIKQIMFQDSVELQNTNKILEDIDTKNFYTLPLTAIASNIARLKSNVPYSEIMKEAEIQYQKTKPLYDFQKDLYQSLKSGDAATIQKFYDNHPTFTNPITGKTIPIGEIPIGKMLQNTFKEDEEGLKTVLEFLPQLGIKPQYDEEGNIILNPSQIAKVNQFITNYENNYKQKQPNLPNTPSSSLINQQQGFSKNNNVNGNSADIIFDNIEFANAFLKVKETLKNISNEIGAEINKNIKEVESRYKKIDAIERNKTNVSYLIALQDPNNQLENYYKNESQKQNKNISYIKPSDLNSSIINLFNTELSNNISTQNIVKNLPFTPMAENAFDITDAGLTLDKQNVMLNTNTFIRVPFNMENLTARAKEEGKSISDYITFEGVTFNGKGLSIITSIPTSEISMENTSIIPRPFMKSNNLPTDKYYFQIQSTPTIVPGTANDKTYKDFGEEISNTLYNAYLSKLPQGYKPSMTPVKIVNGQPVQKTKEELNLDKTLILLKNYDLTKKVYRKFEEQVTTSLDDTEMNPISGVVNNSIMIPHTYQKKDGKTTTRSFRVTNLSPTQVKLETRQMGENSWTPIDLGVKLTNSPDNIVTAIDYFINFVEN